MVGAGASHPVFVMTSLIDYLPGSAVTNGIPAPDNFDVTLLVGRQVSGIQILQSIASRVAGGLPVLAVILLALGIAIGLALAGWPQGSYLASWRVASWLLLGISAEAAILAITVHLNSSTPIPEARPSFWLAILLPNAGLIAFGGSMGYLWRVTAGLRSAARTARIRAVARSLGTPDSRTWLGILANSRFPRAVPKMIVGFWAAWGWRGALLLAAVSITLASVVVFELSSPMSAVLAVPLEGGRVPSGQLSLLPWGEA